MLGVSQWTIITLFLGEFYEFYVDLGDDLWWVLLGNDAALEGELCEYDFLVFDLWRVPRYSIVVAKLEP